MRPCGKRKRLQCESLQQEQTEKGPVGLSGGACLSEALGSLVSALGGKKYQEADPCEFPASQGCIVRLCLKNKNKQQKSEIKGLRYLMLALPPA